MSTPAPPDDLHSGDLIGDRYRIGPRLGAGGMADVWEATDERLHPTVAIKVLRHDPVPSEEATTARRRFRDEGRLAARHIHRNIVAVFDAGSHAGRSYLVMEHLSGETLRDRLATGALTDDEARELMADVLAALVVAHEAGIVHRDIKPSNILCDGDGRWKVADFGIAKALDQDADSDHTLAGQVIGTPRYMAPERLAGQPATAASDIFSVGVVLREALGDRDDADPMLVSAATRACSVDPAQRFATGTSMADAIAGSLGLDTATFLMGNDAPQLDDTRVDETAVLAAGASATLAAPAAEGYWPSLAARERARVALMAFALVLVVGALAAFAVGGASDPAPLESGPAVSSTTLVPTTTPNTTVATTLAVATTAAPTTTEPPTTTAPAPKPEPKDKTKDKGKKKG